MTAVAMLCLASCGGPADDELTGLYDGISPDETIYLTGTEPFWNMEIAADSLTYSTPDTPTGRRIDITRFAGNGGLGVAGTLDDEALQIAVTPGECSDAMSDRTYPFTATVSIGEGTLFGCGYTNSTPYTGEETP
ncbi:MAG: hypothetical protein ABJ239_07335 [Erythrobacter sp.]